MFTKLHQNLTVLLGSFATLGLAKAATAAEKPNVIVIVEDDLGYSDLGVTGNRKIKTPHLDELANKGALLTNF